MQKSAEMRKFDPLNKNLFKKVLGHKSQNVLNTLSKIDRS